MTLPQNLRSKLGIEEWAGKYPKKYLDEDARI